MALDPVTAVVDLIKTGLDKFVADKMPEADKEKLKEEMSFHVMENARNENNDFYQFIVQYEGEAKDVPRIVVILRSLIRPCFTILIGYLDWAYFDVTRAWTPAQERLLLSVNLLVLLFWFGERAVVNSGLMDILKGYLGIRAAQVNGSDK